MVTSFNSLTCRIKVLFFLVKKAGKKAGEKSLQRKLAKKAGEESWRRKLVKKSRRRKLGEESWQRQLAKKAVSRQRKPAKKAGGESQQQSLRISFKLPVSHQSEILYSMPAISTGLIIASPPNFAGRDNRLRLRSDRIV